MQEDHQPSAEANTPGAAPSEPVSDISSVMGSIAEPSAAPAPEPHAGQGNLRPVWPIRRGQGAALARRYALFARLAATACALLFFYVAWAPLATAITSGDLRNGPDRANVPLQPHRRRARRATAARALRRTRSSASGAR